MKKRILALALSMCIIFSYVAFLPFDATDNNSVAITASADNEGMGQYSNSRNFDNLSFEDAKYFYYNQLNDREKELYNILKNDSYVGFTIKVPKDESKLVDRAYKALIYDFPMYKVYYGQSIGQVQNTMEENISTRIVEKNPYAYEYNIEKVKAGLKQVVSTVESSDRYTTVRKLWDYTLRYSPYSPFGAAYEDSTGIELSDKIGIYNGCAIGYFVSHFAICEGLSDSIKIICNELEIPCILISNAGHGWNIIEMDDGKWYCFDCSVSADFEMAEREGIKDYMLDYLLIGFNDNQYWDGIISGDNPVNPHFISDPYIFSNEDLLNGTGVVVPEISYESYVYNGTNNDFSYEIAELEFVEPEPTFIYKVDEDGKTCTITDFYGKQEGDLVIPSQIDGYTVTRIGPEAFYTCVGFDGDLYLPDTVDYIGIEAFLHCKNIKKIHFTDSVRIIDDYAFASCINLSGQLELPNNLEVLGNQAFLSCISLSGDIRLPNSLKKISESFYGCTNLDGYLYLPDNIDFDGGLVAYTKIKGIKLYETNNKYAVLDDVLYTKDKKKLLYCPVEKEGTITFPNELEEIGRYAFFQCEKMTGDLVFPPNLKIIGGSAFQFSGFNGKIVFNDGLEFIGNAAFSYVHFKGDLIIPDTVSYIGYSAFFYCLANCCEIKLPKNIDTIQDYSFWWTIKYDVESDDPSEWFNVVYENTLEELIIPDNVTTIEHCAFEGLSVKHLYLNNVQQMEDKALFGTQIYVRDNGKYIWKDSILHCRCNNQYSIEWCKSNDKEYVIEHEYNDSSLSPNENGEKRVMHQCKYCNHNYIETIHTYGEWELTTEPTCQKNGEATKTCTVCGDKEKRVVYSVKHDYSTSTVEPTCTEYGYDLHTCSMCGESYKDNYVGFTGHQFGDWNIIEEPTCNSEGKQERKCSVCGEVEIETICQLGHNLDGMLIEPTCTSKGYTVWKCRLCGNVFPMEQYGGKTEYFDALGHDYKETVVDPTCTSKGYTNHKCTRCDEEYNDTVTEITTHSFGDWTVTTDPTCTEKGVETRKCNNCEATEVRDVAPTGHSFGDWDIKSYDPKTGKSKLVRKCEKCSHTETKTEKGIVQRYAGSGRFATAAEISKGTFESAKTVVLAYGLNSADALAGVPLAAKYNAPILLTNTKTLPSETLTEIKRLGATNVIILGGEGAIGKEVENALKKEKITTKRIAGKTRFGTATAIAEQLTETPEEIFFVYAFNFADALSASTVAAVKGAPIIYLKTNGELDADTAAYLAKVKGKVKRAYVIGGTGVISDDMMNKASKALGLESVTRVAGANRYATCIEVNNKFKDVLTGNGICVAKGLDFPDALAGGGFAALKKMPLFLADGNIKDIQSQYLGDKDISNVSSSVAPALYRTTLLRK